MLSLHGSLSSRFFHSLFRHNPAFAQQPFLSSEQWVKLRDEASGAAPYENLRYLTRLHRVPATAEFDQAADFILQRAREYGLAEVQSEQFPIDGKTQYGLMRSYLAWRVEAGQLWEVRPQHLLLGDWATDPFAWPITVTRQTWKLPWWISATERMNPTTPEKMCAEKLSWRMGFWPGSRALAVVKYGAAGIVSDMPNQTTAWSGLDRTIVRWGHLEARSRRDSLSWFRGTQPSHCGYVCGRGNRSFSTPR